MKVKRVGRMRKNEGGMWEEIEKRKKRMQEKER